MDAFHPIRKEKIQDAKNKVFRKLYDTKELKEKTVNKLVQSEDLRIVMHDTGVAKTKEQRTKPCPNSSSAEKPNSKANLFIREEKVKEAKEKNKRGYYDNQETFSKIAQRLLDLFGI